MRSSLAVVLALGFAVSARAQSSTCRSVAVQFQPIANLQIAVWIEDDQGNYVDTAYVSRMTGSLGLANRPGAALLKTDFRFPYGRRVMVLPVWAHKRNHPYGYVVMGGAAGNSMTSCEPGCALPSDCNCDDNTIGYHFLVSSPEPFYCSPRGGVTTKVNGVDVVSCASAFFGSKGAYADPPAVSYYPPRADLTVFLDGHDGTDARNFSKVNDLLAVSGATPPGQTLIDPPIRWNPPADGKYVLKVELSQEADFNMFHNHPSQDDDHGELNSFGHNFLGQPSVVYAVPFTVGAQLDVETTSAYEGYGDWDGATGTEHLPDMTITDMPGTGAGRVLVNVDQSGQWRIKVVSSPTCGGGSDGGVTDGGAPMCEPPLAPASLVLVPHATSIDVSWSSATMGPAPNRFDLRYREAAPISDDDFLSAIPSSTSPPPPGAQGSRVSTMLAGLRPETTYYVAVRSLAMCDAASPIAVAQVTTGKASFVTLHGCFIATAAYGTPLANDLDALRRLRDRHLLTNPLGQLAVASYYALSPPIAGAIASDERLRAAARTLIAPLVDVSRALERVAPVAARKRVR